MSNGGDRGILKFVSTGSSRGKQREYMNTSTKRSHTQHKQS